MLEILGALVRNLVIIIFITSLLEMLLPHGQFNRYLRMVTGLLVILMIINILGVLLHRSPEIYPAEERFMPAFADAGTLLWENNQTQVLAVYRASLASVVREEIETGGKWKAVRVALHINEDRDSLYYGTVQKVDVTVARAGEDASPVKPVKVEAVDVSSAIPAAEAGVPEKRVPALEEALARRLQVEPSIIAVTLQGRW